MKCIFPSEHIISRADVGVSEQHRYCSISTKKLAGISGYQSSPKKKSESTLAGCDAVRPRSPNRSQVNP